MRFLPAILLLSLTACPAPSGLDVNECGPDELSALLLPAEPVEGDFAPRLVGSDITYTDQYGHFALLGETVIVTLDLEWQNRDPSQADDEVEIVPPYVPLMVSAGNRCAGYVEPFSSDFGSQGPDFTTFAFSLQQVEDSRIAVWGRATTMDSERRILRLGDGETRRVTGTIVYRTNGTFQY